MSAWELWVIQSDIPSVTASSSAVTPMAMAVNRNASGVSTNAARARMPQSVAATDWIAAKTRNGIANRAASPAIWA